MCLRIDWLQCVGDKSEGAVTILIIIVGTAHSACSL